LLNGPNVKFTSARQFLPVSAGKAGSPDLRISISTSNASMVAFVFRWDAKEKRLDLDRNIFKNALHKQPTPIIANKKDQSFPLAEIRTKLNVQWGPIDEESMGRTRVTVRRFRCFWYLSFLMEQGADESDLISRLMLMILSIDEISLLLQGMLHLAGLRGN